ncbi:MAG: nitrogen regulatory protein, partial [Chlamydiia bacterium]|nr:nitrogen regulatory protein [Chlamydiia bacterium]
MDLEVKEVSELLNVPIETLLEWIDQGKIPAYSIQNHFRFNREEIEEWLLENPQAARKAEKHSYNLLRALNKGDVICDIHEEIKEAVISAACQKIASKLNIDPEALTEIIMEREQLTPTALT